LVVDNLNTHRCTTLVDAFDAEMGAEVRDRFAVHYTLRTETKA
jgi:hypothetical protein